MSTPRPLFYYVPGQEYKSGVLIGREKYMPHPGGWGNKYPIYSAPCSLGSQPNLMKRGIPQIYRVQIHLFHMTGVHYRQ